MENERKSKENTEMPVNEDASQIQANAQIYSTITVEDLRKKTSLGENLAKSHT